MWRTAPRTRVREELARTGPGYAARTELGRHRRLGQLRAHRFFTAGDFPYHCRYHGVMTGTVTVNDAAPDSLATVSIVSSSAPFPAASIRPGGRVTWINHTALTHTVTSN